MEGTKSTKAREVKSEIIYGKLNVLDGKIGDVISMAYSIKSRLLGSTPPTEGESKSDKPVTGILDDYVDKLQDQIEKIAILKSVLGQVWEEIKS